MNDKEPENPSVPEEVPNTTSEAVTAPATQDYFFPTHGITVAAASKEEAEKKLAELLDK